MSVARQPALSWQVLPFSARNEEKVQHCSLQFFAVTHRCVSTNRSVLLSLK